LTDSIYWASVETVNPTAVQPITIKRTIGETDYYHDCFVTLNAKEELESGKLNIGDIVLVAFIDADLSKAIVLGKVVKTW